MSIIYGVFRFPVSHFTKSSYFRDHAARAIHSTSCLSRRKRLSNLRKGQPIIDEGVLTLPVNLYDTSVIDLPDENTLKTEFDGVRYDQLPRLFCHFSKNNTKLHLWDRHNTKIATKSCWTEGFRNSKKSTTVAGQVTALAMCKWLKREGITTIRMAISGLGPGRAPTIQTFQKENINVVALCESTDFNPYPPRPKKMRRT